MYMCVLWFCIHLLCFIGSVGEEFVEFYIAVPLKQSRTHFKLARCCVRKTDCTAKLLRTNGILGAFVVVASCCWRMK